MRRDPRWDIAYIIDPPCSLLVLCRRRHWLTIMEDVRYTPLPVYDSGSKPLEVVGELTLNIKDMEIKDEKIKKDIVGIIGQSSMIDMEKSFDWLKEAPDSEDYSLRLWCIKQSHPRHKDVYGWIKQENRQ